MAKTATAKVKKSLSPASKKKSKGSEKPKSATTGRLQLSDSKIALNVQKVISEIPRFRTMEIRITAEGGVIRLRGTASQGFKNTAGRVANGVSGVQRVINSIVVPVTFGCDPSSEIECFCQGKVTCIPIGQDCADCGGSGQAS